MFPTVVHEGSYLTTSSPTLVDFFFFFFWERASWWAWGSISLWFWLCIHLIISEDFLGGPAVKNLPAVQKAQETQVPSLGQRSPGGGHGNPLHCSCLENPWTEEPGGLQSMGAQRVRHDWSNWARTQWLVMLSIFSCAHRPFVYLFWRNVYSDSFSSLWI